MDRLWYIKLFKFFLGEVIELWKMFDMEKLIVRGKF